MTDTDLPTPRDDIEIVYSLGTHGWSDLYFLGRDFSREIQITHILSDPTGDLIELCSEIMKGADNCTVKLPNEPGMVYLDVARYKQRHIIKVTLSECKEWEDPMESAELLLEFDIRVHNFVHQLYHQFDKLYSLLQDKAYAKDRDPLYIQDLKELREEWLTNKTG